MRMRLVVLLFGLLSTSSWADNADPLKSPQWETMHSRFLKGEATVWIGVKYPTALPASKVGYPGSWHLESLEFFAYKPSELLF